MTDRSEPFGKDLNLLTFGRPLLKTGMSAAEAEEANPLYGSLTTPLWVEPQLQVQACLVMDLCIATWPIVLWSRILLLLMVD